MSRAVIVTGASHGIGRAAAVLFARKGYSTVINYHRSESEALSLAHSLTLEGCSVLAVQADVSDPVQVKELFQRTEAAFGGLEILVNNAGISQTGLFTDCTPRQWDRVFGVNVKGAFSVQPAGGVPVPQGAPGEKSSMSVRFGESPAPPARRCIPPARRLSSA